MRNILYVSLQFSSMIAFGMFWYKLLDWTPEESVCMAIVTAISALLLGAYWGKAQYVLVFILLLSLIGVTWFALGNRVCLFNNDFHKRREFFTPGILLLSIIFLYGIVAFRNLVLYNWDELHQWGKAANFMLHNNALPSGASYDGDEVLLSTTTVFHYYFCKLPKLLSGKVIESNYYVSNLVLWFSAVILPLGGLRWKDWKKCFTYAAIVFLSMNIIFVQPYYNIYCDQPVCMWAGALIAWNVFCEERRHRWIFIVLAILNVALLKNMMGPLFAIVIVLSMLIKYIVGLDAGFRDTLAQLRRKISVSTVLFATGCIAAIFIPTLVWSRRIGTNALVRGDGIIKTGDDRLSLTLNSGFSKWFQPVNLSNTFPNLTFFLFLLVTVILSYILSKRYLTGIVKKQYQVLIVVYAVGFFGFFAIMMYTYLTTFSYADSIVTGSLNRYFSDYMMLGILPILMPIVRGNYCVREGNREREMIPLVLLLFVALGTTNGFASKAFGKETMQAESYKERVRFDQYRKEAFELMDNPEKIYMINQDSNGIMTVIADYVFEKLIDRAGMCYYFTEGDTNTAGLSWADIRALPQILLNGYGYLWIYKTNNYFNNHAFNVLKIEQPVEGDFYKVQNCNGRLRLKYLGNLFKETD